MVSLDMGRKKLLRFCEDVREPFDDVRPKSLGAHIAPRRTR